MFRFIKNIPYRIEVFYYNKKYGKYKYPVIKSSRKCFYKNEVYNMDNKFLCEEVYQDNAYEVLSDFAEFGLYFPFQHDGLKRMEVDLGMNSGGHCHSLEELALEVYLYPENFRIEFDEFYSKNEIKMIEAIRSKCKSLGLKDISKYDEKKDIFIDYIKEHQKRGLKVGHYQYNPYSVKRIIK